MHAKEIKSLIWLSRWYNGRSQRLEEVHQTHLATLNCLVLDELGGTFTHATELTLCGFTVGVAPSPLGLMLLAITPPELLSGEQLILFSDDELATVLADSQSTQEALQREAAA